MNCKPGDLAIIIGSVVPEVVGTLVDVIETSPNCIFLLPDGRASMGAEKSWVIKFQRPAKGVLADGLEVFTEYGVIGDSRLRPIRDPGEDAVDETLLRLPAPTREEVSA